MLDAGDAKHQGAENSALKNNAPFSLTPLRISENASIRPSGRPAKLSGRTAQEISLGERPSNSSGRPGMVVDALALHNCRPRSEKT